VSSEPSSRRGLFRAAAQAAARAAAGALEPAPPPPAPPPSLLNDVEQERYSRQLVLPEWGEEAQVRLRDASVLVVGAGALGSPVAAYLAGAGVGRLGILDGDDVEVSNLHRQHLHLTTDVGEPKAHSAVAKLQLLNPEIMIEPYQVHLDEQNAPGLIVGHDLVVDCSDSFATRYTVNAACCQEGVPLVEGGVAGFAGLVMSIVPGTSACYRCAFPDEPAAGSVPSCGEAGVLGPAAGVIGSLQALEALKLLAGLPGAMLDSFIQVDLITQSYTTVLSSRRPDCVDCGPLGD
jgi:molybdopterin/thiamine biosynthesis adenylyltransferase